MDKIKIVGGNQLNGKINISGAKNAALPLICGCLLTKDKLSLTNMPILSDIKAMNLLLEQHGVKVNKDSDNQYTYQADNITSFIAPYDYVRKMRASYYVLGPLLARFGHCEVSLPGGCAIGARPMDIHLSALEQMGAVIEIKNGYVVAKVDGKLKGCVIDFNIASVGATCNIMMAATLAEGITTINNAAKEPEIEDLGNMLNQMGAKIVGAGSKTIVIEGVKELHGTTHKVISDRIEAGSYAVAAAITKGKLELVNAKFEHLRLPLKILQKMGIRVEETENSIIIDATDVHLTAQDIMTDYYPGFPTDLQAQYLALMTVSKGAALVTETVWENRFMHVPELMRMGANINVHGHASAIIRGVEKLSAAPVMATDLRASFALVLAGLVADGETTVARVYHLDRGYEKLEEKLKAVGANIRRVKEDEEV